VSSNVINGMTVYGTGPLVVGLSTLAGREMQNMPYAVLTSSSTVNGPPLSKRAATPASRVRPRSQEPGRGGEADERVELWHEQRTTLQPQRLAGLDPPLAPLGVQGEGALAGHPELHVRAHV
jgi:hypothetical protein